MWRRLLLPLLLCALVCGASEETAAQAEADALWTEATEKMAANEHVVSVSLLLELAETAPQANLADDALFLAASLLEEELSDPAGAQSVYRRLVEHYPDSRSSLAAQRRLAALDQALGDENEGAIPLARFGVIQSGFPDREPEESLAMAKALLDEFPDWSEAHRIRQWIAEASRREGDLTRALRSFEEIDNAPDQAMVQKFLGTAELQILLGLFRDAEESLAIVETRYSLTNAQIQALAELRRMLERTRARTRLLTASYVSLIGMLIVLLAMMRRGAGSWRGVGGALLRPPIECYYLVPMAALFTAMAFTGHEEIGPAVAIISGGAVIITWLSASALRSIKPLRPAPACLCGLTAFIATLSLCYVALNRSQLLDLIITTVRFGPE